MIKAWLMKQKDVQKKVAFRDISNIEKSQIFVLFENEASYEEFVCPQMF